MKPIEIVKKEYQDSLLNGVYYLSSLPKSNTFGEMYIKLRTAEGRIYDDSTVKNLPEINRTHRHFNEWEIRKNSSEKLIKYLAKKKSGLSILDLGCGNGWLANKLSEIDNASVLAADINKHELEQAYRVFGNKPNLIFAYADLFNSGINEMKFDIIILAGVLMYFESLTILMNKLTGMLNDEGEIHILDNALYNEKNVNGAKQRTLEHYIQLGMPEMARLIHHHLLSELDNFNPKVIYNPNTILYKMKRKILGSFNSPFYWIKIN